MKKDDNEKKDDLTQEEIQDLLDELKKSSRGNKKLFALAFLLHPKFVYHIILSLSVNLIMAAVVMGFLAFLGYPVIYFDIVAFLVAIILYTLVENFLKIILYRYFLKYFIISFGLLSLILNIIIFWSLEFFLKPNFYFYDFSSLIMFATIFSILRFILANYIKSFFMSTTNIRRIP
ncbi:MAG: phage holin family protein [Acholeplasmataceae bacterium]